MFVLGENHFRKYFSRNWGVWLVRKIEFSGNWFPLTEKKWLWLQKSFYTFIFTSKYFWKKRERESERARGRRPSSSPVRRSPVNLELQSALISWAPVWRPRSEIAISWRWLRSHFREIAPSIAIDGAVDGLELAKHRIVELNRALIDDDFFSGFCPCFSGFVFSFFFSKHQKIFFGKFFEMQPNTWKHFPFRKIAFSENGIFQKWNIFQKCFYTNQTQPKTQSDIIAIKCHFHAIFNENFNCLVCILVFLIFF